jgi:UDP-N-acetyl-2-amino-2-deoxyglucuronate dehydrogenase
VTSPEPDPVRPSLRFAVVGSGVIAGVIAAALADVEDAELRVVVGRSADSARRLADQHGARWTDDIAGWLRTPVAASVDVVVVATPSGTHAGLVITALEAGKHVLVEKPIEVSLEAADRIIDAERRTGNIVAVVSQHRFDAATERVVEAVRSGGLGRLTSAIASCAWWRPQSYYDGAAWRGTSELDGGGAIMNQGIHLVDLLLAVMGEPVEVYARTGLLAHEGIEVEDTAVATVEFASGALGVVHATTAASPGLEASLRIHGDRGSAVIVDDELVYLGIGPVVDDQTEGAAAGEPAGGLGPAHVKQLRDLVAVIRARQTGAVDAVPRVGTTDGRGALALVLAMYDSARSGRPVRL